MGPPVAGRGGEWQDSSSGLLEVTKETPKVLLDQRRSAGQVGSMPMEIDGIGHRAALMAQQLGAVLGRDDAYRMGREAVAKGLNRNLRQTGSSED